MSEEVLICPVCERKELTKWLTLNDYFLSQEVFNIVQCSGCSFKWISPRPTKTEIGRYYQSENYCSHHSRKKDFFSWIYRNVRKVSIYNKFNILVKYAKGNLILDIGCGTGEFLSYCNNNGFICTGVEPERNARKYAQSMNNFDVYEELDQIFLLGKSYSCITMWHVLEHIHELHGAMTQIKKLLSNDGVLIVAVPNSNSWDAGYFKQYWAAYDVPRHLYHFTPQTMNIFAHKQGFKIEAIIPQKLDAFYVAMLSLKYKGSKSSIMKMPLFGIWSNFKAKFTGRGYSSMIFILSHKKA